jgi:23S rRNA (uracil1939-C5)-methyltransferase
MARELRAYVTDRLAARAATSVVDAYAGEGELAATAERQGATVTVIELDPEAVVRARARLSSGARVIEGRVEDVLETTLPADVVVFNPPRTGLHDRIPQVLERGTTGSAARAVLLYVSCNPATLARDIARLPSYRIATLTAFDMFPQTAHVETVCELIPEAA